LIRIYITTRKQQLNEAFISLANLSFNLCVNVQLKNKSKYSVTYLMGILGGYPSNVSHLVNQTQPHIQAERHKSQQRKKYKELATLPGITAVKKFPKKNN
jgi:hypothetical protein